MNIEATKLELMHLLLQTQKESLLKKIKKIFEEEQIDIFLTEEQYQIIDKRREKYQNGQGKSLSWEEVKQQALKTI